MSQKTVLVAIDANEVQNRFAVALQGSGHRAVGVRQLDKIGPTLKDHSEKIDLLVLDLTLADDGVSAVRTIRQVSPALPVMVFSGSVGDSGAVRALTELGVTSFVNEHISVQRILPSLAPLLFPDSFDRRTSHRVTLGIPAALKAGDSISAVLTLNLGKGGMAVRVMNALDTGTRVTVRFRLPRSQADIEALSRVVWSDRQSVVGLQFEEVHTADQSAVDEFVDQSTLP